MWVATFLFWVAAASGAAALDMRIVVIDTSVFASIEPRAPREDAVRKMVTQLRAIEIAEPAKETILFYEKDSTIERLSGVDANRSLSGQAVWDNIVDAMIVGTSLGNPGLELEDLHQRFQDSLHKFNAKGMFGFKKAVGKKLVAVHLFAQDWRTEEKGIDVSGHAELTQCVFESRNIQRTVQDHVTLSFDFLPPMGGLMPSAAAQSALIAVVAGRADPAPNVQTRGVIRPGCLFQDALMAQPWNGAGYNGPAQCEDRGDVVDRDRVTACSNLYSMPGVAPNIDQMPVYLTAVSTDASFGQIALNTTISPPVDVALAGRVGSARIAASGRPTPLGLSPARYPAALDLQTQAGCRPGAPAFRATLGDRMDTDATLQVTVSRRYCQDTVLTLPSMEVR